MEVDVEKEVDVQATLKGKKPVMVLGMVLVVVKATMAAAVQVMEWAAVTKILLRMVMGMVKEMGKDLWKGMVKEMATHDLLQDLGARQ